MIEAYAVSVRIGLKNAWSAGLFALNRGLIGAGQNATALQSKLNRIKLTMMAGGLMVGAGALGLYAVEKTLKPAEEYAEAINRMRLAGMSNIEVAQSVGAAWRNTGAVITTTATENISALLDLRSVLGSTAYAIRELPFITKIGTVLAASTEGKAGTPASIAFTMAKALDIIGAARDPKRFESEGTQMERVITAFQGRVSPRQYQSVFQYARQAKMDLSDEFKYQFLPSLMLEMSSSNGGGGGSRGVGPMLAALYRFTNQGYITKKSIPELEKLGLLTSNKFTKTTTKDTVSAPLKDAALAANNPFLWSQNVLLPAIKKAYGANVSEQQIRQVTNMAFRGNQLAAAAMTEFLSKPQNFLRDQRLIQSSTSGDKAFNQAMQSPAMVFHALQAQLTNAEIKLGIVALPAVIKAVKWLTAMLVDLNVEMQKNPAMVKAIVVGFVALSAALVFGGSLLLIAGGFAALATVIGSAGIAAGIFGVVIGLTAFGAALLLWGPQIKKALTNLPGEFMANMKAEITKIKTGLHGAYDVFAGINTFDATRTKKGLGEIKSAVNELLNILRWVSHPATAAADLAASLIVHNKQKVAATGWIANPLGALFDKFLHNTTPNLTHDQFRDSLRASLGMTPARAAGVPGRPLPTSIKLAVAPPNLAVNSAKPSLSHLDLSGAFANAVPRLAQAIKIPAAPKPLSKVDMSGAFKDALRSENLPSSFAQAVRNALAGISIKVDARGIGQFVMNQIGHEAAKPPTGPSGFDTRLTPAYSGKW